jgi:hypothetical protein
MPRKNKFENLKFEKSNAQFKDRKLLTGYTEGKFTTHEIATKLQQLADGLNKAGRNAYVGVSIHYRDPNAWLPAIYTHVSQSVQIYNPTDSDTTHDYKDIDGCLFYILKKQQGEVLTQKFHSVKKNKINENVNLFV